MTPYQSRCYRQTMLWANGRSEHNPTDNECCPDFSCCYPDMFEKDSAARVDYFTRLMKRLQAEPEGRPRAA